MIIQDNCYIGSNCSIDRGSFSDTFIGENVYLDDFKIISKRSYQEKKVVEKGDSPNGR